MSKKRFHIKPIPQKHLWLIRMILLVVITWSILLVIDEKITPIINSLTRYQVKIFATDVINTAVSDELSAIGVTYDEIIKLNRNDDGDVTDLQTDIMAINRIQTRISARVLQSLKTMGTEGINIPLGSLMGSVFLSGRGPDINFIMLPVGTIKTDIQNEFLSAGINQTLHRMILIIEVEIATDMAGYTIPTTVKSSICIGETIIVGVSPEAFTNVENSSQGLEGKLFDYRAGTKKFSAAAR